MHSPVFLLIMFYLSIEVLTYTGAIFTAKEIVKILKRFKEEKAMPQPRGKVGPYKRQEHKKKELEDKRNEMDKKEYKIHVKDTGGWVCLLNNESYRSAHAVLNVLVELEKMIKSEAYQLFYHLFATSFIYSII